MSGSTETEATKRNLTVKKPAKVTKRDAATQPAKRPVDKERSAVEAKPEKLVCRYCGSDDLSPNFVKRRDSRCRKCFSQPYGSKVGGNDTSKKK